RTQCCHICHRVTEARRGLATEARRHRDQEKAPCLGVSEADPLCASVSPWLLAFFLLLDARARRCRRTRRRRPRGRSPESARPAIPRSSPTWARSPTRI